MHGIGRRVVGIIAVVALFFVFGPGALASAATTSKLYSLNIATTSPTYETTTGEVASGETVGIAATFTNETTTQQIGSANLVAPSGFTVVGVSPSSSASLATNCSVNGATVPACVALRNLALAPGASATVTMTVATPSCEQPGSSYPWSAEVKQANNYNGPPGNDFFYDASMSQPLTTVDGACALAFVNEPRNELLGNAIDGRTDWWFPASGTASAPVTVEVLASNGTTVVSGFRAPVAAGIGVNAGGGTLSGTNPQTPSNGTASFTDLEISTPANGYELSASSGTLTNATSSTFDVAGTFASCSGTGNSCHTDATGNNGDGSLDASIVSGSGLLLESANANSGAQLTCSASTSADPNTYSFLTTGTLSASKVFTITILGVQINGPVSKFLKAQQICFGVPSTVLNPALDFTTATGTPAPYVVKGLPDGTSGYVGPLPNCTGSTTGPCQKSASATLVGTTYTVTLVADVPSSFPGDPYMR